PPARVRPRERRSDRPLAALPRRYLRPQSFFATFLAPSTIAEARDTMTSVIELQTRIPAGTWQAHPVHSSVGFAVKYLGVATFTGELTNFAATLTGGQVHGRAAGAQ